MQKNRWLVMLALCAGLAAQPRNGNEEAVQKVQAVTLNDLQNSIQIREIFSVATFLGLNFGALRA